MKKKFAGKETAAEEKAEELKRGGKVKSKKKQMKVDGGKAKGRLDRKFARGGNVSRDISTSNGVSPTSPLSKS